MNKKRDVKILSYTDLLNETINNRWITVENECEKKCQFEACTRTYTQTFISDPLENDHEVEFIMELFAVPSLKSRYFPVITLGDLFFQIISSFNFFTGLTVSHLFKLIKLKKIRKNFFIRYALYHLQTNITRANKLLENYGHSRKQSICTRKWLHLSSKNYLLVKKIFVYSACFIGCNLHIGISIKNYMKYPTILETSRDLESNRDYSLSICLDWLNIASLSQSDSVVTISQIFKSTPPADQFISDCAYWGLSTRLFNDLTKISDRILFTQNNSIICNKLFKVDKFIRLNYMCYKIEPIKKDNWTRGQINNVFLDQKVLFMISVKNSLLTDNYRVSVSTIGSYPILSIIWSNLITRTHLNLWFTVDYHLFIIQSLPAPYSDDGFTQMELYACTEWCLRFKYPNVYSAYGVYFNNENDTSIAPHPLKNSSSSPNLIRKFERTCAQLCQVGSFYRMSHYNYTQTSIDSGTPDTRMTDALNPMSAFYVMSTNTPIDRTVFKVKLSLFELVITIGNIIGIWFGLSVVQMNPFAKRIQKFTTQHVTTLNDKIDLLQVNLLRNNQ